MGGVWLGLMINADVEVEQARRGTGVAGRSAGRVTRLGGHLDALAREERERERAVPTGRGQLEVIIHARSQTVKPRVCKVVGDEQTDAVTIDAAAHEVVKNTQLRTDATRRSAIGAAGEGSLSVWRKLEIEPRYPMETRGPCRQSV